MEDILKTVIDGLEYEFFSDILIKPLEVEQVTKEFTTQVPTGKQTIDKVTGNTVEKYNVKKETKKVDATFQKGIVLFIPEGTICKFKVGDTIVFPKSRAIYFDLFKDSMMIKIYDIVAIHRPKTKAE